MDIAEKSLQKHYEWKGKVETVVKTPLKTKEDLSLAYTPGVARACLEIQKHPELSYELTGRANTVAVITDGTAILGLGDIGGEAGMPVMEGKCALFKEFGRVDAFPLCLKTKETEEIINIIENISGSFGGINLEDISAPRCFEIERRLQEDLNIPVFHDDQHGTAIVAGAALINALKVVKKDIKDINVVINGAGAAGISIARFLIDLGVNDVVIVDKEGIICDGEEYRNLAHEAISHMTNKRHLHGLLKDAMVGMDVFVGVSVGKLVSKDMIKSMNHDAIVFPLANPIPEITYEEAKEAGARIVGTGSSQYPNQINNALVFPGLFRGALDAKATKISKEMLIAASYALASVLKDNVDENHIIPDVLDQNAHDAVANAVKECAIKQGLIRESK